MDLKICALFFICVYGYTIPQINITSETGSSIKNIQKIELEIWRATKNQDLPKAVRLESLLEREALKAAMKALLSSNKDLARSKRSLKEVGTFMRRHKRTMEMLTNLLANENNTAIGEKSLIRKVRQDIDNSTLEIQDNELSIHFVPSSTAAAPPTAPARQEEEENPDEEEEGGGGIGGLISSFLGSLSTPEGGIDLDAVTGLLGGLSTQNDDGTFDFTGLQDSVGSLFGGAEEGGSNVGQFIGGLLGATIRGSAGEQAAKGAGKIVGNILTAALPGLSAYPEPEEGANGESGKPRQGLDSGRFLAGVLKSVFASSGNSSATGQAGGMNKIMQIKYKLFKGLFSIITHILGSSSG